MRLSTFESRSAEPCGLPCASEGVKVFLCSFTPSRWNKTFFYRMKVYQASLSNEDVSERHVGAVLIEKCLLWLLECSPDEWRTIQCSAPVSKHPFYKTVQQPEECSVTSVAYEASALLSHHAKLPCTPHPSSLHTTPLLPGTPLEPVAASHPVFQEEKEFHEKKWIIPIRVRKCFKVNLGFLFWKTAFNIYKFMLKGNRSHSERLQRQ